MPTLLIDTNVLVLMFVGVWDRDFIAHFRRTDQYKPKDFDLLQSQIAAYPSLVTTAGVLTEVSNLMGNYHLDIAHTIQDWGSRLKERFRSKDEILADPAFDRLGFADCSILAALDEDTTVLTDDVPLYLEVLSRGRLVINFSHVRRSESR